MQWELLLKAKDLDFKKISVHEAPELSPGFLLWRVSTSWRSRIEKSLKLLGLTHPQFVVLAATGWLTKEGEKATQIEVGKMAGLDRNTISQILKGLEEKEWIKRLPSEDARAKHPLLTPKGSKLLKTALPVVEEADAQFFNALGRTEMDPLISAFQKLMHMRDENGQDKQDRKRQDAQDK